MPTLDGTHKRSHCSSVWTDHKETLQYETLMWKNYTTTSTQDNMSVKH